MVHILKSQQTAILEATLTPFLSFIEDKNKFLKYFIHYKR